MEHETSRSESSRRDFLRNSTLLGGALAAGSIPQTFAAEPAKDGGRAGISRALLDVVRHRFAGHELGADMKAIEEDIVWNLAGADALRRVPLQNGDEPDFTFKPEGW